MKIFRALTLAGLLVTPLAALAQNNGGPGANLPSGIGPSGRLTLTSATPVLTATTAGATSVLWTPYRGNQAPVWNGSTWYYAPFPEIANVLSATTVNNAGPAAVVSTSLYDMFLWYGPPQANSGFQQPPQVPYLTRGPAWTNSTTRSLSLTYVQGILANTLAIVNGPPALQGVYVGTIASNSTSTVDWILGAAASGGTAARLALWNNFNRLPFSTTVTDSGALYTYSVATNREARASTGNQMTFVTGLVEDNEHFENCDKVALVGAVAATATWGFGLNSLTAFVSQPVALSDNAATATNGSLCASISLQAPIGLNVVSMQEIGDGTNANSFDDATLHYMSAVLNQ